MVVLKICTLKGTEEPEVVVSLKEGEHVIGRGGLLQCYDKRISRQHAILQVTKEFITLKSVHINPCFFKGANDSSVSIITQNTTVVLKDGDNFSLLPDNFWFKVRIVDGNGQTVNDLEKSNETLLNNENISLNRSPSKSKKTYINTTLTNGSSSKRCLNEENLTESCKRQKADHQEHTDEMSDERNISRERTPNRASSPGLDVLLDTSPNVATNGENSDSVGLINSLESIVREDFGNANDNVEKEKKKESADNLDKAETANSNGEVQVKEENVDENVQVKQEPEGVENQKESSNETNNDVLPPDEIKKEVKEENCGCSKDDGNKDNASKDETDKASSSTNDQDKKKRRERCWFGATCYRKNPIHRVDFSHPGDNDYDSDPDDDRPACPYGVVCYRKNIDHRKQYKHIGPPMPKPPNIDVNKPKKKRRSPKKKQKDDGGDSADDQNDSNDNGSDNDDGTKKKRKAARNKKYYDDTPEDDYDYEDPFIDDGSSSEFEMSSDDDDSTDWDDSQKVDEESQETRRLLKEAKRFTKKGKGKKKD